jgi:addiction module HigA family antidote
MTAEFLAFSLGIPIDRVKSLLAGDEPVTAELSAALARAFNTTSEFWLNLQAEHEERSRRDRL